MSPLAQTSLLPTRPRKSLARVPPDLCPHTSQGVAATSLTRRSDTPRLRKQRRRLPSPLLDAIHRKLLSRLASVDYLREASEECCITYLSLSLVPPFCPNLLDATFIYRLSAIASSFLVFASAATVARSMVIEERPCPPRRCSRPKDGSGRSGAGCAAALTTERRATCPAAGWQNRKNHKIEGGRYCPSLEKTNMSKRSVRACATTSTRRSRKIGVP